MTDKPKTMREEKIIEHGFRRFGKSTFVTDSFLAGCDRGEAVEFHHPKFIALSNKAYENRLQSVFEEIEMKKIREGLENNDLIGEEVKIYNQAIEDVLSLRQKYLKESK